MRRILNILILACVFVLAFSFLGGMVLVSVASNDENNSIINKGVPLTILMYHEISDRKVTDYVLSPSILENDLKWLKQNGYTGIFMQELIDHVKLGTPLPAKPVIITFDDGSRTDYTKAFPILKKYNTKAVISVVGRYTDRAYDESGNENGIYTNSLTFAHMKEMLNSGLIEIQNHTYDLHSLTCRKGLKNLENENIASYKKLLTDDLTKLDNRLNEMLGIKPTTVTFPYGAYSKHTLQIVKELGYSAALTCNEGINYINANTNLYLLKRYNRCPKRDLQKLFAAN